MQEHVAQSLGNLSLLQVNQLKLLYVWHLSVFKNIVFCIPNFTFMLNFISENLDYFLKSALPELYKLQSLPNLNQLCLINVFLELLVIWTSMSSQTSCK